MTVDYLSELNQRQRKAVEHGITDSSHIGPPVLVLAGAGSGKTKTLAHRVAHLIVKGASPDRILLMTFSRRAAEEMVRRVDSIVAAATGIQQLKIAWAGTFHAICLRLLRRHAEHVGLSRDFTVLNRPDAEDLMDLVRQRRGLSGTESRFPKKKTCLKIYSLSVNVQQPVKKILKRQFRPYLEWTSELRKLFAAYEAAKRKQNVVDYDDLLHLVAEMLHHDPILAQEIGDEFDHILVDEYQDTNRLQAKILKSLKPDGSGTMVVGDDAQSIYSFRGATVKNILRFPRQYGGKTSVIKLRQNYRSTQPILAASNAVISLSNETFKKTLFSDRASGRKPALVIVPDAAAQARYIADQILEDRERGIPLKSQAVLFRASHDSTEVELELARRNIPFKKYGGLKFLEAGHIRDVLSILRWCENPRDRVAGFRTLKLLPGVGPVTAEKILKNIRPKANVLHAVSGLKVSSTAGEALTSFARLFEDLRKGKDEWPSDLSRLLRWYEPQLSRLFDDAHLRLPDLEHIEKMAAAFDDRISFLTDLTLDPPDGSQHLSKRPSTDDECTILSTIHSAKGQEWRTVRILNAIDGCIPSSKASTSRAIEEERRLLYVAMTRAKDELDLLVPRRIYSHRSGWGSDAHDYSRLTQFIPSKIGRHFETKNTGAKEGRRPLE